MRKVCGTRQHVPDTNNGGGDDGVLVCEKVALDQSERVDLGANTPTNRLQELSGEGTCAQSV